MGLTIKQRVLCKLIGTVIQLASIKLMSFTKIFVSFFIIKRRVGPSRVSRDLSFTDF